jgi:hypothetical protein
MKLFFGNRSILRFALIWALIASVQVCQAQPTSNLSKHARKVQKTLAHYPANSHLHLVLRDHSDRFGTLGALSETSFLFTNVDDNATGAILYDDVVKAQRGVATVRTGGLFQHHRHALIPVLIVAVAAGVGVGIIAASRD